MSNDHDLERALIAKHEAELAELMKPIIKKRRFINGLYESMNCPPKYPEDEDSATTSATLTASIRNDQWTGKPLASAVEELMNMRRARDPNSGAPSLEEIHSALLSGGFQFKQKGDKEQLHQLTTTLGKNTSKFRKINGPQGEAFGLQKWYGGQKVERIKTKDSGEEIDDSESVEESESEPSNFDQGAEQSMEGKNETTTN